MVSGGYAVAGAVAAVACQGVPQLLGHRCLGVDCGSVRHMLRLAEAVIEERVGVVQVCFLEVGSVVASGLRAARIEAVRLLVVVGSVVAAVADARVESLEVVDRIGLPVEAQSTAVDLAAVAVGLSRVRHEVCGVAMG